MRTFAVAALLVATAVAAPNANTAATPAEWKAAQEAAKAKAAQALSRVAAEKSKAAASAKHQAIKASEKAKKANDVERNAKSNGAQRMDVRPGGEGDDQTNGVFNSRGFKTLVKGSQGEHAPTVVGDTKGLYCQAITGRSTDKNGVLYLGTKLNPLADSFKCDGPSDPKTGVCCPKSCGSTCDSAPATCSQRGGSLCCAKAVVQSQRICSPLNAAPCVVKANHGRALAVQVEYAPAFARAKNVCFSAYGFYCEKVLSKIDDRDELSLVTAMNPKDAAITIPAAQAGQYKSLARVCLHPDVLSKDQAYLKGTVYRHQDDFDNKVVSDWRAKYNLVHPGQTGYARESDDKFNTWPAYKKFLPAAGCCKVCDAGKPCGKSCIATDKTCSRDAGVHDWCACDKETAEKLELLKKFPANIGKPDSWQGFPHTYPKNYRKGMLPEAAATFKDFDTYEFGQDKNQYDNVGRMMPKLTAKYSPSATKSCCREACAAKYANADTESMRDCVEGCDLWIAKSSLNWDGTKWLGQLQKRCTKDCSNILIWKTREASLGHTCPANKKCTSYFHSLRTPQDETVCAEGCSLFNQCIVSGGAKPSQAKQAAKVAVPDAVTADSRFCRKGWGILEDVNSLRPDAPRACCHYSCGKCITNCNAENGNNGLFHTGTARAQSARLDKCCVSRIIQAERFCDSHTAPCVVPPVSATRVSP